MYLAGASLVTMYFMTGEGKALEDESLMTSVLLNILEFLDTLPVETKVKISTVVIYSALRKYIGLN